MRYLMRNFTYILDGDHSEDRLVKAVYARKIGLHERQIKKYVIGHADKVNKNGLEYYWKSKIDELYESDFIQDQLVYYNLLETLDVLYFIIFLYLTREKYEACFENKFEVICPQLIAILQNEKSDSANL